MLTHNQFQSSKADPDFPKREGKLHSADSRIEVGVGTWLKNQLLITAVIFDKGCSCWVLFFKGTIPAKFYLVWLSERFQRRRL